VQHQTLAMYGEDSPFLTTCRYLEENLANCRAALVPSAKHRAHEENPPGYVALVQQHLREMAGVTPSETVGGTA
jgi:pimeloyl-ACP methyl ester carboxylesterase